MPTAKFTVMLGDLLSPLNSRIVDHGNPVDLDDYTLKFRLLDAANAVVLNDVTLGVTAHPTQVFTVDAASDIILCDSHGVRDGSSPMDQVKVSSSGTLPLGLDASRWYFPLNVHPHQFQLSITPGGPPVAINSAGTGTHTFKIRGTCQMDFSLTEVDADGLFKGLWRLYDGSEFSTFPKGRGEYIPIDVPALG